jgi:hypothetical protein
MALAKRRSGEPESEAFDELNHVYLHEPDPLLEG